MTSAKHKNPPAKPKEKYSVQQALTNYYLLVMFTLFPLFFTDAYFNIRHDKYYFFIILTGILVIAEFLIIMTASVDKPPEDPKLENLNQSICMKSFRLWTGHLLYSSG